VIQEFLAWKSPLGATRKTYTSALRLFFAWARRQPDAPLEDLAQGWLAHLLHAGKSAATLTLHAAVVRQFGRFLVKVGQLEKPLVLDNMALPKPEKRIYQRGSLSRKMARRLVDRTGSDSVDQKRTQAVIALMSRAGLRSCEVVRANVGDLGCSEEGLTLLWVQGKGRLSADAFVVLNESAQAALSAYLETRGELCPDDPLITGLGKRSKSRLSERQVQRLVTAALEGARLKRPRISTHSLRHTAASLAVAAGMPLPSVQAMMRHEDLRTTTRYVHLRDRLKRPAENALNF
jgi:site-specific recombinase XerD